MFTIKIHDHYIHYLLDTDLFTIKSLLFIGVVNPGMF